VTSLEEAMLEAIPTGRVRERTQAQGDLCLVLRTEVDTRRETRMLDALERANRLALRAWQASGRAL
jgi:hypothetical protein